MNSALVAAETRQFSPAFQKAIDKFPMKNVAVFPIASGSLLSWQSCCMLQTVHFMMSASGEKIFG
jgi:hypothetical protein